MQRRRGAEEAQREEKVESQHRRARRGSRDIELKGCEWRGGWNGRIERNGCAGRLSFAAFASGGFGVGRDAAGVDGGVCVRGGACALAGAWENVGGGVPRG